MALNPSTQYADDHNLRARQRLWGHQVPSFDLVAWVLDLAGVEAAMRVLDVGCGNGSYLHALSRRRIHAVGCDLSLGMLRAAEAGLLINADVVALPLRDATFDVVLAPHMLYHVPDREAAAHELRRVTRPGGRCIVVTNGSRHMESLRALVEAAAREATSDWTMRNPSTHEFSLDNGASQLAQAFETVTSTRPAGVGSVVLHDPTVVAGYVASVGDHYGHEVARPWPEIVEDVRRAVADVIERDGAFTISGDVGAFVCR